MDGWHSRFLKSMTPVPSATSIFTWCVKVGRPVGSFGSDSDRLDQMCPASSPDGARLAYGQAEGTADVGYTGAALVISDLDVDGNASVSAEIDVGGTSAPPCPTWSPDGQRIALGVHEDVRGRPQGSAAIGDVWVVVSFDSGQTTVLSGLYVFDNAGSSFPDMEWSPDGTELAIANGQITLVSVLNGKLRSLLGSSGAGSLTWSPDGTRIAYQRGEVIRVVEVHGTKDYLLASDFASNHRTVSISGQACTNPTG
jgi:WD40 repeat protein